MKMNPNKTQSMIVSRSRTLQPQHPDHFIDNIPLITSDSFKILGITSDSKFNCESHLRSDSSVIAQKLGLLKNSYKIYGDPCILLKCFNYFILSCFENCSPVWYSAADSHLNLLDRNLNACKFLIPDLSTDLWHRRSINCLCMFFQIYHSSAHPLYSELSSLFHFVRETIRAVHSHSHSFSFVRCSTA